MYFTVYEITNKLNGKKYIGKHQTKDLNDSYMGSGKLLRRAQKKYGIENFEKEILFVFETEEEMNLKEKELVTEDFCDRTDTYNICVGGKGGFSYINRTHDPSSENEMIRRQKIKQKLIEKGIRPPEYVWSQENRQRMSERMLSAYSNGRKKGFANKKHSIETRNKMSENSKGKGTAEKNSQYGSFWITNGSENRKSKSKEHPAGFWKGRSY